MGRSYKKKMLGTEIQRILGDMLIKGDLKNPAFKDKMIGINGVDVSGDGSYATIYITAMSFTPGIEYSAEEKQAILDAFEKSKGFIRTEIGKGVKLHHLPELSFKFDESFEYGMKMDRILDSLK